MRSYFFGPKHPPPGSCHSYHLWISEILSDNITSVRSSSVICQYLLILHLLRSSSKQVMLVFCCLSLPTRLLIPQEQENVNLWKFLSSGSPTQHAGGAQDISVANVNNPLPPKLCTACMLVTRPMGEYTLA